MLGQILHFDQFEWDGLQLGGLAGDLRHDIEAKHLLQTRPQLRGGELAQVNLEVDIIARYLERLVAETR